MPIFRWEPHGGANHLTGWSSNMFQWERRRGREDKLTAKWWPLFEGVPSELTNTHLHTLSLWDLPSFFFLSSTHTINYFKKRKRTNQPKSLSITDLCGGAQVNWTTEAAVIRRNGACTAVEGGSRSNRLGRRFPLKARRMPQDSSSPQTVPNTVPI